MIAILAITVIFVIALRCICLPLTDYINALTKKIEEREKEE